MNAKWGALQFSLSSGLPGRGNSGEWNLIHTDAEEGECWVRKRGPGDQDRAAEAEPQCPPGCWTQGPSRPMALLADEDRRVLEAASAVLPPNRDSKPSRAVLLPKGNEALQADSRLLERKDGSEKHTWAVLGDVLSVQRS